MPTSRLAQLSHITLPVTDLALAEAFYVGLLGGTLVRRVDRAAFLRDRPERAHEADAENSPFHIAVAVGSGAELQLFLQPPAAAPSLAYPHSHLAFLVTPELLTESMAALAARGVPTAGPLRLGPPGHASLYFLDPFGNRLELAAMGMPPAPIGVPEFASLAYRWNDAPVRGA